LDKYFQNKQMTINGGYPSYPGHIIEKQTDSNK